jgi:sugar transferase (PEP-CTERM/EpsH1 system associated)
MVEQQGSGVPVPPKRNMLFLTQRIPYPPIKGEKIRPLQILKHFRENYNVHLGCLIDDPRDWEHVETVKSLCADAYFGGLNRKKDSWSHVGALLSGEALSVAVYRHKGLADWVSKTLKATDFDAVFVCSSNMAPYVLGRIAPTATSIVDLADVDSEKWRAYADKASTVMRWVFRREARLVSALEARIAAETDFSTFVSEPEAALFRTLVPGQAEKIVGVPSGIDHVYFDPHRDYPAPYDAALPTFVFTGTMDYIPNVDAVCWFAREILPLIRQTHPAAQFYIVGSSPAPAVQQLDAIDGVHVTGRVPDVRPYLHHATAAVAPMRIARGIQNKVMEAMAMAKPVIVTPDALEGIDASVGKEIVLATDAASLAAAASELTVNRQLGRDIGAAARQRMVECFSWDGQLRGFDRLLKQSKR